jgi:hypothetical protein
MRDVQRLIAGDTLNFTTTVADYPADDGWTLKYRLVPRFATPVQAPIELTASAYEVSGYHIQVAAVTTASWKAGVYEWASWVQKGAERITIERGQEVTVEPDPAAVAQGTDSRSSSRQALEAVQAKIKGKATDGVESYEVNGRQLKYYSLTELLKLEQRLINQVAAEDRANGIPNSTGQVRRILVRTR